MQSLRDKIIIEKEIRRSPNTIFIKIDYTMNNGHLKLLNYKPLKLEKVQDNNHEATREWVKNHVVIEDYN